MRRLVLLPLFLFATKSAAQLPATGRDSVASAPSVALPRFLGEPIRPAPDPEGRYILVTLSTQRLFLISDRGILWSTPIGSGTGDSLIAQGRTWEFSTPVGAYEVLYKELDPVWQVPDWFYLKQGKAPPAADSSERMRAGDLGAAAIYFSLDLALHGTDHPDRLGQAVSHGCIRLSNDAILRLYEAVQVGTPVIIQ